MTDTTGSPAEETQPPRSDGVPAEDLRAGFDDLQPETQGESPLDAELGEGGQGDILDEDEPATARRDAPEDLRVEDLP